MEEILASIRRIIADDQENARPPEPRLVPPPPAPAPPPVEEEDILDLAEVAEPVPTIPSLDLEEADVSFRDPPEEEPFAEEPPPEPPRVFRQPEPPPPPPQPARDERLISSATDASVGQTFNLLAHTVLANNARTLDDIVREMLRPMLKNWLDDNLPSIVERLVRAEIERVARGR